MPAICKVKRQINKPAPFKKQTTNSFRPPLPIVEKREREKKKKREKDKPNVFSYKPTLLTCSPSASLWNAGWAECLRPPSGQHAGMLLPSEQAASARETLQRRNDDNWALWSQAYVLLLQGCHGINMGEACRHCQWYKSCLWKWKTFEKPLETLLFQLKQRKGIVSPSFKMFSKSL